MRRLLAGTLLAAAALTATPASAGCVDDYLRVEDDDGSGWAEINRDDLSVHVYPARAVADAGVLAVRTAVLVNCIV